MATRTVCSNAMIAMIRYFVDFLRHLFAPSIIATIIKKIRIESANIIFPYFAIHACNPVKVRSVEVQLQLFRVK